MAGGAAAMREYVRPDLADAVRRIKLRMQAEHARTIRELDQLLCDHDWIVATGWCTRCGLRNHEELEQHHNGHYGAPGLPVCVCLVQGAGRAFCPIHAADENPCGKGCSDPRAHAEGAHDV